MLHWPGGAIPSQRATIFTPIVAAAATMMTNERMIHTWNFTSRFTAATQLEPGPTNGAIPTKPGSAVKFRNVG